MIINFDDAMARNIKAKGKKLRYIIIIGEDEEPLCTTAELEKGTITVMINARTPEETACLWKQNKALGENKY